MMMSPDEPGASQAFHVRRRRVRGLGVVARAHGTAAASLAEADAEAGAERVGTGVGVGEAGAAVGPVHALPSLPLKKIQQDAELYESGGGVGARRRYRTLPAAHEQQVPFGEQVVASSDPPGGQDALDRGVLEIQQQQQQQLERQRRQQRRQQQPQQQYTAQTARVPHRATHVADSGAPVLVGLIQPHQPPPYVEVDGSSGAGDEDDKSPYNSNARAAPFPTARRALPPRPPPQKRKYAQQQPQQPQQQQQQQQNNRVGGNSGYSAVPHPPEHDRKVPVRRRSRDSTSSSTDEASTVADGSGHGRYFEGEALPMTVARTMQKFGHLLTPYEQSEIFEYDSIYFPGKTTKKIRAVPHTSLNCGFDDERGDYRLVMHDHIAFRFEVLSVLGKGSFGQVVKVLDHKTGEVLAMKLIRSKKRFQNQAQVEVKVLEHIVQRDTSEGSNIIHMTDTFMFRKHLCITFALMGMNLYEYIKHNHFKGCSLAHVQCFAKQLVSALSFLESERIIHCDLKPENILLHTHSKTAIKLIDFGSSCYVNQTVYTYIQSRFYRSPEVVLGLPYGLAIDMWSLGCILSEMYTGYPLFPGENEAEQIQCMMEVLDVPPREMLEKASRRHKFFDADYRPLVVPNSKGRVRRAGTRDLFSATKCNDPMFISFLEHCLRWDPNDRLTAVHAESHPWILGLDINSPEAAAAFSSRSGVFHLPSRSPRIRQGRRKGSSRRKGVPSVRFGGGGGGGGSSGSSGSGTRHRHGTFGEISILPSIGDGYTASPRRKARRRLAGADGSVASPYGSAGGSGARGGLRQHRVYKQRHGLPHLKKF